MPYIWKRYYIPIGRYFKLIELVRDADIIHIMGHWTLINAIVYLISRAYNKPYVFCPAGALPLFGRSVILKKIYNLIIGNQIIKNANGWIAVTKTELSDFLYYGISQSNINIIPNGVDIDDFKHILI
jgi:glycosyltransferase involved in cell wall biosynthesis